MFRLVFGLMRTLGRLSYDQISELQDVNISNYSGFCIKALALQGGRLEFGTSGFELLGVNKFVDQGLG